MATFSAPSLRAGEQQMDPLFAKERYDGWWRKRWAIAIELAKVPTGLRLPAPSGFTALKAIVIASTPAPGQLVVDVMTRNPEVTKEEVLYTALLLRAISSLYGQITIDGRSDHPILHIDADGGA